jgi:hypothetical protein
MANGVRADGSRFTLGTGTRSWSSPVCDWIRPRVTIRRIAGRRGGKRAFVARPGLKPGTQWGYKAVGSPGEAALRSATEKFGECLPCNDLRKADIGLFHFGIAGTDWSNYARNGTKPAHTSTGWCLHDSPRQTFASRYRSVSCRSGALQAPPFFAASYSFRPHASPPALSLHTDRFDHRCFCLRRSNLFNVSGRWQRRLPAATLLATEII